MPGLLLQLNIRRRKCSRLLHVYVEPGTSVDVLDGRDSLFNLAYSCSNFCGCQCEGENEPQVER
jgi:hypothetical protein